MTLVSDKDDTFNRQIAGKLYFDWIQKHQLLEILLIPTSISDIIRSKNWVGKIELEVLDDIFQFLNSLNYLNYEKNKYSINPNYLQIYSLTKFLINEEIKTNQIYQFVRYGLTILDAIIEDGNKKWETHNFKLLYEFGLTQKIFNNRLSLLREYIANDITTKGKNQLLIFANYILPDITSITGIFDDLEKVCILTPTQKSKEEAISSCELNEDSSQLSNSIKTAKELGEEDNNLYNVVIVINGLQYYQSMKANLQLLKSKASPNSLFYFMMDRNSKTQIGIEPLLFLHPQYKGFFKFTELISILEQMGFSEVSFKDDNRLILSAKLI